MDFSTFHWVVQSGKRWEKKWGSPGMHCLRDEYTVGVWGNKRRFLLAKINEAVAEAAEVWGAVQMLKEQQAAFQLIIRAGGSAWTNASLCENKQFIRFVVCEGFFLLHVYYVDNLRQSFCICTEIRPAVFFNQYSKIFHFKLGLLCCQNIFSYIHQFWRRCARM